MRVWEKLSGEGKAPKTFAKTFGFGQKKRLSHKCFYQTRLTELTGFWQYKCPKIL